jgi:membrane protein
MLLKLKSLIHLPPFMHGPWLILKVIYQDVNRGDVFKHASAMAYVTLLSLVPSIAAVFSLVSVFSPFWGGGGELMGKLKAFILSNLAQGSGEQAIQYFESFIANLDVAKIGITGFVGIMVSLILLLRNIERALNEIFHVTKERNIFSRFVNFWTFVTLGTFIAGISIGVLSGFNLSNLNPFQNTEIQRGFGEWMTPKIATFVFFTLLYKVTPNTFVPTKFAAIGAVVAGVLFSTASSFYGVFATKFTNYQAVYGALAAVPLFLLWLYLIWVIILVGGVVTQRAMVGFDLEQTEKDLATNATNAVERHRDHQLQDTIPLVLLMLVYQQFLKGGGKGLRLADIRRDCHLPEPWLIEGIELLEQLGYIAKAFASESGFTNDTEEFFPTFPPDSLKVADVLQKFRADAANWLEQWRHQLGIKHQRIIDAYWQHDQTVDRSLTVSDLIARARS